MSSVDELLKKHFEKMVNITQCTIENLIQWLKVNGVFEKMSLLESDLRTVYKNMRTTSNNITFRDFLLILQELAKKTNRNVEEFKNQILKQLDSFQNIEINFREEIKRGKATLQDVMDWMKRNEVFEKMGSAEAEVVEIFTKMKLTATNLTYEDLKVGLKELAARRNIDVDKIVNELIQQGLLPPLEKGGANKTQKR